MFGSKTKKRRQSAAKNTPHLTPEPTVNVVEPTMPDLDDQGKPFPDIKVDVSDKVRQLLKEYDESVANLEKQIQQSKIAKRQAIRAVIATNDDLPVESEIVFDYDPVAEKIQVWKKSSIELIKKQIEEYKQHQAAQQAKKAAETADKK